MTVSIFGILIYDISNSSHSETACSVIVIPFLDFKRKESATRRKRVQGGDWGRGGGVQNYAKEHFWTIISSSLISLKKPCFA